jgi:hypothetical protein
MPTLTALQPRPYIFPRAVASVELVQALPEDLKIFNVLEQKEVLRTGLIYWLQSSINGNIEQTPRKITEFCSPKQLKEWLDLGMIWIAKSPFNSL